MAENNKPPTVHKDKVNNIKDTLQHMCETIAVAESVTAGLLQFTLAAADGASNYFQGGITVYNLGQKSRHLHIDPIHAQQCNSVSEKMAKDMAQGATRLFSSDWGIGITGYATPVPESDNTTYCYIAICKQQEVKACVRVNSDPGTAEEVQWFYVEKALELLHSCL